MRTIVIGCNHRTASLGVRERLAFNTEGCIEALRAMRRTFPCAEGVLLSTCNRTELYVARPVHGHPRIEEAIEFLGTTRGIAIHEFGHSIYQHADTEAIRHLFRVAGSLDSMVLGESQVLSQVKAAFALAQSVGTVGRTLDAIFQHAFVVAKDLHTRTGISAGKTSVGGTAVDFARQIFSRFDDKTVLMIGAGQMGEATLHYLLEMRPKHVLLTNRTSDRAETLRAQLTVPHGTTCEVVSFEHLADHLARADIVISTTGANEPVLRHAALVGLPAQRQYRPLLIIDIAVPRDVDPEIGSLDNVFLYDIDDLQSVAEASIAAREKEIARCHEIIETHVAEFVASQRSRNIGPTIAALQQHFDEISRQELDWLLPKLVECSEHDRKLIIQMVHRITQKLLHAPSAALRDKAAASHANLYTDAIRNLFGLKDED
ncbi:MAG: glutamyl-tRNA reductase [Phycisphaerae bacterium]|nr:glutamyl-tRNA reductase [Phycisphaerae bacterium]